MNGCEDPEFGDLDTYIRAQLGAAAETYAPQADLDARLKAVLEARAYGNDGTAATGLDA